MIEANELFVYSCSYNEFFKILYCKTARNTKKNGGSPKETPTILATTGGWL